MGLVLSRVLPASSSSASLTASDRWRGCAWDRSANLQDTPDLERAGWRTRLPLQDALHLDHWDRRDPGVLNAAAASRAVSRRCPRAPPRLKGSSRDRSRSPPQAPAAPEPLRRKPRRQNPRSRAGRTGGPVAAAETGGPAEPGHKPEAPFTLAIDIGGTGSKASVLDATGAMVADRVVVKTTYPCPPSKMIEDLADSRWRRCHPPTACRPGSRGWSATGSCSRRRTS